VTGKIIGGEEGEEIPENGISVLRIGGDIVVAETAGTE